ncbi:hypothetical protein [Aquirufa aurantiipilula]|uniref:Uncharacterized protein n=1 Tax=Aquirufa aurantiipilula TaxID=2696561 RepID=A0ABT6BMA4_9BACT|nr:hypothetical protein [Aquirufa aurantiipilula]MDF5691610.1 hypothetical protein [Aquirufa aurantiipilula]
MLTKIKRANIAQKRAEKAQKRKAKAKTTKAKAAVKNAKASLNFLFKPFKKTKMGTTVSGNAKINAKEIQVGISLFMNHPIAGYQVIDYYTDLERFTLTHQFVNSTPENAIAYREKMHEILMDLFVQNAPIDEYFFTIGMHYLVSFQSPGAALKSNKFETLGFCIEPIFNDAHAAKVFTTDYPYWDSIRLIRNSTAA